jgi:DNA/RNA endonuclease YhcR with UshA esterase domain
MYRIALALAVTWTLALPLGDTRAQDAATTKPSTQPSTQPLEVIDVKDFAKLKEMIGTEVTVRGKVSEVFVPQSGSVSIFNFEGIGRRDFNVVVRKENLEAVNAGFEGDVAAAVKGKTITVTGTVADYRGNPQLQLTKPEQLKVEKPAEGEAEKPKETSPKPD